MNPEIIRGQKLMMIEQLLGSGWEVKEGDKGKLVKVEKGGLVHCVDGRKIKGMMVSDKLKRGPKVQGGAEGVALMRAKQQGLEEINEDVFRDACKVIDDAGYKPGLHDLNHDPVHCGHCKLLMEGKFGTDMPELKISPQRMIEIAGEYGGRNVELLHDHLEKVVRLNFVEGMTLEPAIEAFNADVWAAKIFGIVEELYLDNAANTVVGLNGPKKVEVFE